VSLWLRGATVVRSLEPPRVERADLLVADGRIAAVGRADAGEGAATLDCSGCLAIPGSVCAHTHAYSALARGMPYHLPAPTSFLEILQRIWWRLDRAIDPTAIRASALVAAREALLAGTTTLVDHHASPNAIDGSLDVIAEAFEEVGIRSVLCYEVTDRDGRARAGEGLDENRRFLRRVASGRWPLARGMVGAHASFTLSADSLAACAELARQEGVGVHVHAAEDAVDQADALARFGQRVVERLELGGALTDASLLAHAIHLDPAEAERVVRTRALVAHNPRSNLNNGVGRTPLSWLGERVALGTDGMGADLFEESHVAYLRRREEDLASSPRGSLAMLAQGAAFAGRVFGEPQLGSLDVGAPADLVVLDYQAPTPVADDALAGHWVFGLSAASVRDVLVGGEVVVRDRRITRLDGADIALEARSAAGALWQRLEGIGPHPFTPTRLLASAGVS